VRLWQGFLVLFFSFFFFLVAGETEEQTPLSSNFLQFDAAVVNSQQCKPNGVWGHTGHNYGPNTKAECHAAISAVPTCNQKMFVHSATGCYCFSDLNVDEDDCSYNATGNKTYRTPLSRMGQFQDSAANITTLQQTNAAYTWNTTGTNPIEHYAKQVAEGHYGVAQVITQVKSSMVSNPSGTLDMSLESYTTAVDLSLETQGIGTVTYSGTEAGTSCSAKLYLALAVCLPLPGNAVPTPSQCAACTHGFMSIQQSLVLTVGTTTSDCSLWFLKIDAIARISVSFLRANWLGTRVKTCAGYD